MSRPSQAHDVREGGRWGRTQRWKNDAIFLVVRVLLWVADRTPRALLVAAGRLAGLATWLKTAIGRRHADVLPERGKRVAKYTSYCS